MLGVVPVAERVAHHLVGHDPGMPCAGQAQHAVGATRGLVHRLHGPRMAVRDAPGRSGGSGRRHLASTSVTALDRLGAADLRASCAATGMRCARTRKPINRLNVYPVPDGDTGTNMALTLESVCRGLDAAGRRTWPATCKAISHGSLMGARGNSGVILSQVLRGLADVLARRRRRRRRRRSPRR